MRVQAGTDSLPEFGWPLTVIGDDLVILLAGPPYRRNGGEKPTRRAQFGKKRLELRYEGDVVAVQATGHSVRDVVVAKIRGGPQTLLEGMWMGMPVQAMPQAAMGFGGRAIDADLQSEDMIAGSRQGPQTCGSRHAVGRQDEMKAQIHQAVDDAGKVGVEGWFSSGEINEEHAEIGCLAEHLDPLVAGELCAFTGGRIAEMAITMPAAQIALGCQDHIHIPRCSQRNDLFADYRWLAALRW